MTRGQDGTEAPFGPWNPGIASQVPAALRPLCTFLRPDNVSTSDATASELHDLTGLDASEIVAFRPGRLALHEVLIRVTADLSVPDGTKIEDLGINFRRITRTILAGHIEPRSAAIESAYDAVRRRLRELVDAELSSLYPRPEPVRTPPGRASVVRAIFRSRRARTAAPVSAETAVERILLDW